MKNTTKKALVVSVCMLFALTHVNANIDQNSADKISRLAWTTVQEKTLTKTDSIAKLAWNTKESFENPKQENLVACAADLEEQDAADKISRLAWTTVQEKTLTKTDSIAKLAWNTKESFENANDENLIACAADLEEQDVADKISKMAWSK